MTKMTLVWHRNNNANLAYNVERARREVDNEIARVLRMEADLELYNRQIAEAERRGVDGFDRARFMINRGSK